MGRDLAQPVVERMEPSGADREDPLAVLEHPLDPEKGLAHQREPAALEERRRHHHVHEAALVLEGDDVALRFLPEGAVTWDERESDAARALREAGAALPLEPTSPRENG